MGTPVRGQWRRNYDAEVLDERPNSSDRVYEIPSPRLTSASSMLVRVHPHGGARWIGIFYEDGSSPVLPSRRGVFATSDPDVVAVMLGSQVWWVNVHDPSDRFSPDAGYVADALYDVERDQIIVAEFSNVQAIGREGVRWEIWGQMDGIRLHEPEGEVIRATGGSVFADADIPFAINARTGHPLEGPIERRNSPQPGNN